MADDIASLIIEIDSKGVVKASGNLSKLEKQSKKNEKSSKRLTDANKKTSSSYVMMAAKIGAAMLAYRAITGTINTFIENTVKQEQAMRQLETAVKSTGGAAGFTAEELREMAQAMQQVTTFGDEAIMEMQGILLTFTKIGRETLPQTTEAVANLAIRMGTDLKSAAIQLGKALNDPIANLSALSRSGIQFSKDQKQVINSLVEAGEMAEAQKIILAELEVQFGGSARAARDTMGGALSALGNKFGDLFEASEKTSASIAGLINTLASWIPSTTNSEQKTIDLAKAATILKIELDDLKETHLKLVKAQKSSISWFDSQEDRNQAVINSTAILIEKELELAAAKSAALASRDLGEEVEQTGESLSDDEKLTRQAELNAAMVLGEVLHNSQLQEVQMEAFEREWELIERQAIHEEEIFNVRMRNRSALDKFTEKSTKAQTKQVLGELINITQGSARESRAMFETNKAAATANAVMNTWAGASKTMAEYPYPYNIGLAALSLASGFAQVQSIQSTSFGGGGGGSISGGGVPSLATSPGVPVTETGVTDTEPTQSVEIVVSGGLHTDEDVRNLVERINDVQIDMGGQTNLVAVSR